jgi:hypothetical protein
MPSLEVLGRTRVLIYAGSKKQTVKVYTLLCNARLDGVMLRPRRVKSEDIRDPPPRKTKPSDRYGLQPVIIIDPAPDVLVGEKLARVAEPLQGVEIIEELSGVVRGARRIIFKLRFGRDRKTLNQMLLNTMVDEAPLKVQIVKTNYIPEPLPPY